MSELVPSRCAGIVLCGGRSRRLGQPKAWLPWNGTTLLGHVVHVISSVCDPVVIARRRDDPLPPLPPGVLAAFDEHDDQGPLAGWLAADAVLPADIASLVLVGCDYPFITPEILTRLRSNLRDQDAAVVRANDRLHPLVAVYQRRVIDRVRTEFGKGERSVQAILRGLSLVVLEQADFADVDADLRFLTNVNAPADLQTFLDETEANGETIE